MAEARTPRESPVPRELPASHGSPAWRAVLLIAVTYVYFLIFAQFGFLKRLGERHIGAATLTPVMAAMALGGVLASLFGQRALARLPVARRLQIGLLGCALAAGLSLLPLRAGSAGAVAALIGLALGLLTVTLVAHLRVWMKSGSGLSNPLLSVGLGTGLGYAVCNIPWLFNATPRVTALVSGAGCLLAACFTRPRSHNSSLVEQVQIIATRLPGARSTFPLILAAFTALIWLDSAAFFIIQNSPGLKAGTWGGTAHLWQNGAIHLAAALASVWLLRRRGLPFTLLAAFACIGTAGLLLQSAGHAALARLFYPAGVSLYSVALVAYPSLLLRNGSERERERRAGLLYAVAGWMGSALGIGMGQHLHRIPTPFLGLAGVVVAAPPLWRWFSTHKAPAVAMAAVALAAFLLQRIFLPPQPVSPPGPTATVAEGRQVYIAEGCISCHSQYIRPQDASDMTLWGPSRAIADIRREHPPLIGNRRQGPDLSEVGSRRSPLWLRMHFMNPRDVSPRSIMPGYAYLFDGPRGDALLAYVGSLQTPAAPGFRRHLLASWVPVADGGASGAGEAGELLFQTYCATCHVAGGRARTRWGSSFRVLPPELFASDLPLLPREATPAAQRLRLERIVKFGLPGTDMPGHEYLPDADISSLAAWLIDTRAHLARASDRRSLPVHPAQQSQ